MRVSKFITLALLVTFFNSSYGMEISTGKELSSSSSNQLKETLKQLIDKNSFENTLKKVSDHTVNNREFKQTINTDMGKIALMQALIDHACGWSQPMVFEAFNNVLEYPCLLTLFKLPIHTEETQQWMNKRKSEWEQEVELRICARGFREEDDEKSKQLIAKNTINISARDHGGATALSWALYFCNLGYERPLKTIPMLLEAKADINCPSKSGRTPLMLAIKYDRIPLSIIELLLKYNPNINLQDEEGKTAWDYAQGKDAIESLLKPYKNK